MNPNAVGLDPESSFRKGCPMTMAPIPAVALTPVAYFPENYFLENLVVRADGSVLVTTVLQKELWYVPSAKPCTVVSPVLLHTFKHPILGIVEAEPDVIMVSVCDLYHTHESQLARIDFKGWTPGKPVKPEIIFSFDDRARGLNGSCMLGPGVMALADCFAGLIWRVDLSDGARSATARVWLAHDTMAWDPDAAVAPPPQPGVNGIRYSEKTGYVYYTSTAQKVFMRISVGKASLDPVGDPEFVAGIDNCDDFCIDEDGGFAYVSRHRANTLDRVPLQPGHGGEVRHIVDDPSDRVMVGPTSAAWRRGPGDYGRVFYLLTDGGRTAWPSPDGIIRRPALLRAELHSVPKV
jgi:hypothetical protein